MAFLKKSIEPDGNCLFRAVSYFIFNTEDRHYEIRLRTVSEIVSSWEFYKDFLGGLSVDEYQSLMSTDREYGTSVELSCIGRLYPNYLFRVHYIDNTNTVDYGSGNIICHLLFSGDYDNGHFDVLESASQRSPTLGIENAAVLEVSEVENLMDSEEHPYEKKRKLNREALARCRAKKKDVCSDEIKRRLNREAVARCRAKKKVAEKEALQRQSMYEEKYIDAEECSHEKKRILNREAVARCTAKKKLQEMKAVQPKCMYEEVDVHYCGPMNIICAFCKSKNFAGEKPTDGKFTNCCQKGKVKLSMPTDTAGNLLYYPNFLKDLLSNVNNPNYANFRNHVRSYNSALSFASMGAKLVHFHGKGPYVFKVHGQICHSTSHTLPVNDKVPQYAQLYVIDSTQATENRVLHSANEYCIPQVLDEIDRFFRHNNRLCDTYRMLRDVETRTVAEAKAAGKEIPVVHLEFKRDRRSDQRRYNAPNQNEIAMVFVDNDGEPPFQRDIRVYPRNPVNPNQPFININILSPNLDPMCYPILFPYGEAGWQPNWMCEPYVGAQKNPKRNNISMLQYKSALLAVRDGFNPIISAGKLSQQWIVDSYLQVEANNLNYIKAHQKKLRAEQYQGLVDHIENAADNVGIRPGIPVILPSSFEGSPRNMRERCTDAMSIFGKYGPPDLFITFTANPQWTEILENLKRGEQPCDRPDLVARVFKLKLKSLMQDLTVNNIFGTTIAFVYSIEFQKRGLPHAHILVVLRAEDKFSNAEKIDRVVSAEIPPPEQYPRLFKIVTRFMMHGPCGYHNLQAPCMENGQCNKKFPKDYQEVTKLNISGYPYYRRRSDITAEVRGKILDNRYVVPFNPFLLQKYEAHINVEVCTSLRAVKYIYKYIYKGFDCANMVLTEGKGTINEVDNYIDTRYVSAPEAMWRLLTFNMHDRSHYVIRLPVHLPNQKTVTFVPGHEEEALETARRNKTMLESWFLLNQTNSEARRFLYVDIPYHYVYQNNQWKARIKGGDKVVSRMYTVSVKDEERFYLRLLLLHVPGAISFLFLRTVDNVVYDTFKEAAFHRHLLDSDQEWDFCLQDATTYQMPKQIRQTFAFILSFCNPTNPLTLWNDYKIEMSLDYLRSNTEDNAFNFALHDINSTLEQHGFCCSSFGLPMPIGDAFYVSMYDEVKERKEAERKIASLTKQQLLVFNQIIGAVYETNKQKYFYLDGPGGCGKTYLYSTILSYVRGKGDVCLPFATTGIAATLINGGRTVHSGFKLPVPILETSVSSMRTGTKEAVELKKSKLIIIDEVTMLTKDALRCIDLLLREIMNNDIPFGGKVFVIGGDFRQALPVIRKGTRTEILENCIKSSPLWSIFTHLSLTENMRISGQNEYNTWLLNVGSGSIPQTDVCLPLDSIEIPTDMIEKRDLIEVIYTGDFNNMDIQDLSKRVILASTNKKTLEMNRKIIAKVPGNYHVYYSCDSLISEDENDVRNYPIEFLNELTPSGMPPHKLELKVGVIVMLLRNLNPKQGLCNGTRLRITGLKQRVIKAQIISECNRGDTVLLNRIILAPNDVSLPFVLKRRQFPIIPAYAMTINKSQGQTFDYVGIQLDEPVFAHGQLYVALSRCRNPKQVKVFIKRTHQQGQILNDYRFFTKNIVYPEVL